MCLSGWFKDPVERISAIKSAQHLWSLHLVRKFPFVFVAFEWGEKGRHAETKCEGSAAPVWPNAVRFTAGLRNMYVGYRDKRLRNIVDWLMMRSNNVTEM